MRRTLEALERLVRAATGRGAARADGAAGAEAPARASGAVMGNLDRDQVWSGEVTLAGDVFVPAGTTLTIEAGASIGFQSSPRWIHPRGDVRSGGLPDGLEAKGCLIVVAGRLIASGTPEKRIRLGGSSWGGIHFVGDSRGSSLVEADISHSAGAAVSLWGSSEATLAKVRMAVNQRGLALHGAGSRARMSESVLSGNRGGVFAQAGSFELDACSIESLASGIEVTGGEHRLRRVSVSGSRAGIRSINGLLTLDGVEVSCTDLECVLMRGGRLTWSGGGSRGGVRGLRLTEGAVAELSDLHFSASKGHCLEIDGGRLAASGTRFEDSAEAGLFAEKTSVESKNCVFAGNQLGIGTRSARVVLEDCSFVKNAQAGIDAMGGEFRLSRVSVSGSRASVRSIGGDLTLSAVELAGAELESLALQGGRISWNGGGSRGGARGLRLTDGAAAELSNVFFSGSKGHAIEIVGGSLSAAGARFEGNADAGIFAENAPLELKGCVFTNNRSGVGTRGANASLEKCAFEKNPEGGVRSIGGALTLSEVDISGAEVESVALQGGRLSWSGGGSRGGARGLKLTDGVAAELTGVYFSGSRSHGIEIIGGSLRATGARFEGNASAGVLSEGAPLELKGCVFTGNHSGIAMGDDNAVLEDCTFDKNAEAGIELGKGDYRLSRVIVSGSRASVRSIGGTLTLSEVEFSGADAESMALRGGRLNWNGGGSRGGERGLKLTDGAAAELTGVYLSGSKSHGIEIIGGSLTANGARFEDNADAGVLSDGAPLELKDCVFTGNRSGVGTGDADAVLADCTFEKNAEVGIELGKGDYRLSRVSVTGSRASVRSIGGSLTLSEVAVSGAEVESVELQGGRLSWSGGGSRGGTRGLKLTGGVIAELSGVSFTGSKSHGIQIVGGRLTASGARFEDNADTGLISDGTPMELKGCVFAGNRSGVGTRDGDAVLEDCTFEKNVEAGIELANGKHRLSRVSVSGSRVCVRSIAGALTLSEVEVSGAELESVELQGGRLSWSGGGSKGGARGLKLTDGVVAELSDVYFSGSRSHGIEIAGGSLSASGGRFEGNADAGVLSDGAPLALKNCVFTGNRSGVGTRGANASFEKCTFEKNAEGGIRSFGGDLTLTGVEISGSELESAALQGGRLRWRGGGSRGGARGLKLTDGVAAELTGVYFSGSTSHGVEIAGGGGLTASGARFEGNAETGVLSDGAPLELKNCVFTGNRSGVGTRDGDAVMADCTFEKNAETGIEMGKGDYRLSRVSVAGSRASMRSIGGTLTLSEVEVSGAELESVALQGGRLSWSGGGSRGGARGLKLTDGVVAEMTGVYFSGSKSHGIEIIGGRLSASGARFEGNADTGLLSDGAPLELKSCVFTGNRSGIGTRDGDAVLEDCAFEKNAEAGIELTNGEHRLSRVSVSGSRASVRSSGGTLTLSEVEVSGAQVESVAQQGGRLRWNGGGSRGGERGLKLTDGVVAEMTGVYFSGSKSHGIEIIGGRLSASGARFEDNADTGVLSEGAPLELKGCVFMGNRSGIAMGDDNAVLEDCTFEKNAEAGIELGKGDYRLSRVSVSGSRASVRSSGGALTLNEVEVSGAEVESVALQGGRLSWSGGGSRGGTRGLKLTDGVVAELSGVLFSGSKSHGIEIIGGRLSASGARFEDNADTGVLSDGTPLELKGCAFTGNRSGLGTKDADAVLEDCAFEENAEAGIELANGKHRLSRVSVSGSRASVRSSGGDLALNEVEVSGAEVESVALHGGRLSWSGGGSRGGTRGLKLTDGVVAELSGVRFSGSAGHGMEIVGGRLTASGARFEDNADSGMLSDGAPLELRNCVFAGNRSAVASKDGNVVAENCTFGKSAEGGKDEAAEPGHGRSWREVILNGVLATRALPPFAAAYRAAYTLLIRLVQAWTWTEPRAAALYIYRSWVRDDWQPGTSDVDMILVARPLEGEEGGDWVARFSRFSRGLRRVFPFCGEILVLEPDDIRHYLGHGGFRARGLAKELRSFRGEKPAPIETEDGSPDLEALVESTHAYTRLMSLTWDDPRSSGRSFQTAKAAGDVLRCWSDSGPATAATLPRRREFNATPKAAPLRRFERAAGTRLSYLELCAETLLDLHHKTEGMLERRADPAPMPSAALSSGAVGGPQPRLWDLEMTRSFLGDSLCGVAWDDIYRSYFILDDDAMTQERVVAALQGIDRLGREHAAPRTLPMILSRRLWELWSQLPYLECPTRWMEILASDGSSPTYADSGMTSLSQFHWGTVAPRRRLHPEIRRRLGVESLASFRWSWRHAAVGSKTLSPAYTLHYLNSRVIGLRLLVERGIELPFFQLDVLRQAFRREFPRDAAENERLWRDAPASDGLDALIPHYDWVDRQVRRSAAALRGAGPIYRP